MQNALIAEVNPGSLHALAQKCLLIDQNIQQLQAQESRNVPQTIANNLATQTQRKIQTPARETFKTQYQGSEKQKLYRLAHKVPATEKLMQEGKCFVCQKTGHRAFECPSKRLQINEVDDRSISGKE